MACLSPTEPKHSITFLHRRAPSLVHLPEAGLEPATLRALPRRPDSRRLRHHPQLRLQSGTPLPQPHPGSGELHPDPAQLGGDDGDDERHRDGLDTEELDRESESLLGDGGDLLTERPLLFSVIYRYARCINTCVVICLPYSGFPVKPLLSCNNRRPCAINLKLLRRRWKFFFPSLYYNKQLHLSNLQG